MGLRVRKSIKLGKHVKLNVWRNGVSYHVPNNKNTKVKTKISTPVRTQQKTMPIETKHILIKYINFIVKIILYLISVFGAVSFICVLFGGGNIATLFGTIIITLGSGIAAKKINIKIYNGETKSLNMMILI